jgi:hypothetical protein
MAVRVRLLQDASLLDRSPVWMAGIGKCCRSLALASILYNALYVSQTRAGTWRLTCISLLANYITGYFPRHMFLIFLLGPLLVKHDSSLNSFPSCKEVDGDTEQDHVNSSFLSIYLKRYCTSPSKDVCTTPEIVGKEQ